MDNKDQYYNGVDMGAWDLSLLSSVAVAWTKVTKKMTFKGKWGYIGLAENIGPGEVIQTGRLGILYKISKLNGFDKQGNRIYRIMRVDGCPFSLVDTDNSYVGGKTRIVSRRTFHQQMHYEE